MINNILIKTGNLMTSPYLVYVNFNIVHCCLEDSMQLIMFVLSYENISVQ
jgi:hypothetical protein